MHHDNRLHPLLSRLTTAMVAASMVLIPGCGEVDRYTYADSGSHVSCDEGDSFEVALSASGSTGISWEQPTISDPAVLSLTDSEYESDSDNAGASGEVVYTFSCDAAGAARLSSIETGPGGVATGNEFFLDVTVE